MELFIPTCSLLLLLAVVAERTRGTLGVAGERVVSWLPPPATARHCPPPSARLPRSSLPARTRIACRCTAEANCYQFGSGGWEVPNWGDPGMRLPPGGAVPICNSGYGSLFLRWRKPAGVFLIPSEQCPGAFEAPFNVTYTELAPVSDTGELNWVPPSQPAGASYWLTSQVPGDCEAGGGPACMRVCAYVCMQFVGMVDCLKAGRGCACTGASVCAMSGQGSGCRPPLPLSLPPLPTGPAADACPLRRRQATGGCGVGGQRR